MKIKSTMSSDSLSARLTAFGRLYLAMLWAFQTPEIAYGLTLLATVMLAERKV